MKCHPIIFLFILVFRTANAPAQGVGIVLSGGGSGGLCHVGMLKALEENHIPIDYITGTSIGALIGAYYAAGYPPTEIEKIVKTYLFQNITRGDLPVKYEYLVKKRDDFAAWISLKYNFRDHYLKNLPTNLINSVPIDYYLMETFTGVSSGAKHNFDSLFVPFRCVASDIVSKKSVVFRSGDLPSALRASISYPFYIRPISIDGKLLYDGGLYDNFPIDVMKKEFHPDVVLGCNVSEKDGDPDDDNLYSQLRTMLTNNATKDLGNNTVIVQPWCQSGIFNFENAKQLIDSGYFATLRMMPQIKERIKRRSDSLALASRRARFNKMEDEKDFTFSGIEVVGFNEGQKRFINRSIFYGSKPFTLEQLKKRYFRLTSDDKIKNIFPMAVYDSVSRTHKLRLIGKKEKPFYVEPGGLVSNRPISEGFLGIQYNTLGRIGFSAYVNGYIGKLYSGSMARVRFDFPGRIPFFIEPSATFSHWDYYSSSALFYDFLKPAYLVQEDEFAQLTLGVPVGNICQASVTGGVTQWKNQYYQTETFTKLDTADATFFNYKFIQTNFRINTLNRKMYATEGTSLYARLRYLEGVEDYSPGNTSENKVPLSNHPKTPWLQLKVSLESYLRSKANFKIGFLAEGVYSTQGFFSNYQASILSAPAFFPTPESQTFFMAGYRAHQYLAGGIKTIYRASKAIDFRVEAYIFQPVYSILKAPDGTAVNSAAFLYRRFAGFAAAVYNSPLGPLSIGVNLYDQDEQNTVKNTFSVFFHFGYIIFNKKSID